MRTKTDYICQLISFLQVFKELSNTLVTRIGHLFPIAYRLSLSCSGGVQNEVKLGGKFIDKCFAIFSGSEIFYA
jgi:hypothetical protein